MIEQLEHELELLQRHYEILHLVVEHEPIGIVSLAKRTGYPNHKVRYSLRTLEEAGLIEPTPQGAVTTDETTPFVDASPERLGTIIAELHELQTRATPIEA